MTIIKPLATGLVFGLVHVLTGPDHISALATLSSSVGFVAFWNGARWGVGHSVGLVLVAIVLIIIGDDGKEQGGSGEEEGGGDGKGPSFIDVTVGVAMLGLGAWGAIKGRKAYLSHSDDDDGRAVNLDCGQDENDTVNLLADDETGGKRQDLFDEVDRREVDGCGSVEEGNNDAAAAAERGVDSISIDQGEEEEEGKIEKIEKVERKERKEKKVPPHTITPLPLPTCQWSKSLSMYVCDCVSGHSKSLLQLPLTKKCGYGGCEIRYCTGDHGNKGGPGGPPPRDEGGSDDGTGKEEKASKERSPRTSSSYSAMSSSSIADSSTYLVGGSSSSSSSSPPQPSSSSSPSGSLDVSNPSGSRHERHHATGPLSQFEIDLDVPTRRSSLQRKRSSLPPCCSSVKKTAGVGRRPNSSFFSFLYGILHGVAGPGGILGVLPATKLGGFGAFVYLAGFCFSSVVTMGMFAGAWGEVTRRIGNTRLLKAVMAGVSSGLSIAVGITWIVLASQGKLDDYFG